VIDPKAILLISYPLIIIGFLGIVFCFSRDFLNIKKGRGRAENTAPEIYWFMIVLIIVGLFFVLSWQWALLSTVLLILVLHPIRSRTKLIAKE
jgi:heme/copper-type cytochrome/quinol oxidase subunit 2